MSLVCVGCGGWVAPRISFVENTLTCPDCGTITPQCFLPLYVLTGPSGTGKTAVIPFLRSLVPEWEIFETDILWDSGGDWQTAKCNWLRIVHSIAQSNRRTLLCGTILPEDLAACEHLASFPACHYAALVCEEQTLRQRLETRPAWRGCTPEFIERQMAFQTWLRANTEAAFSPPLTLLETTSVSLEETARQVRDWMLSR